MAAAAEGDHGYGVRGVEGIGSGKHTPSNSFPAGAIGKPHAWTSRAVVSECCKSVQVLQGAKSATPRTWADQLLVTGLDGQQTTCGRSGGLDSRERGRA